MRRPWLVTGRSHEYEWNGTVGRRFAYVERARAFAKWMADEGYWDIRLVYLPVSS